jgi:hypothetical protein
VPTRASTTPQNQASLADNAGSFIRDGKEEASDYVRKLLLKRISECRTGAASGIHKYEFNRFIVTLDCDTNEVTIEDDLNPNPNGRASWSLEEFGSALWQ